MQELCIGDEKFKSVAAHLGTARCRSMDVLSVCWESACLHDWSAIGIVSMARCGASTSYHWHFGVGALLRRSSPRSVGLWASLLSDWRILERNVSLVELKMSTRCYVARKRSRTQVFSAVSVSKGLVLREYWATF